MSLLDDLAEEVSFYAANNVTLNIVDRTIVSPATPGAVNVKEVWSFRVTIFNAGILNMTGVYLTILGRNGTELGTAAAGPFVGGNFAPGIGVRYVGPLTVSAHSTTFSEPLFFKAPDTPKPAGTELISVDLSGWDANLDYILKNLTGGFGRWTTYSDQVFP